MDRMQKALEKYSAGYDCCLAVLAPFLDEIRDDDPLKKRLSGRHAVFPGQPRKACGAVTAAFELISWKHGADSIACGKMKKEFIQRFRRKHSATDCIDLVGGDISDPGDFDRIISENRFDDRCRTYIEDTVRILEELLAPA